MTVVPSNGRHPPPRSKSQPRSTGSALESRDLPFAYKRLYHRQTSLQKVSPNQIVAIRLLQRWPIAKPCIAFTERLSSSAHFEGTFPRRLTALKLGAAAVPTEKHIADVSRRIGLVSFTGTFSQDIKCVWRSRCWNTRKDITAPELTQSVPELLALARAGQPVAFRLIMRRCNRRLYRIARGIVRGDTLAEDVVQEAYLQAFRHQDDFNGRSAFSTWLTRILMNEALGRLRKASRTPEVHLGASVLPGHVLDFPSGAALDNPEITMAQKQIMKLVEAATDGFRRNFAWSSLPVSSRKFVEETGEFLSLKPETVRGRLHRARALARGKLDRIIGPIAVDAFPFAGW